LGFGIRGVARGDGARWGGRSGTWRVLRFGGCGIGSEVTLEMEGGGLRHRDPWLDLFLRWKRANATASVSSFWEGYYKGRR
jgi:hypothetical protein